MPGGTGPPGPGRRCGDAHIEHNDVVFFRVARQGIGAGDGFLRGGLVAPQPVAVPVQAKFRIDIEIGELQVVRGTLHLDIAPGSKIDGFTGWEFQHQLLDESGDVTVGTHLALPTLHTKDLAGQLDLDVMTHRHLAGEPVAFRRLPFADVGAFGGQYAAAPFQHLDAALTAGTATTAGG